MPVWGGTESGASGRCQGEKLQCFARAKDSLRLWPGSASPSLTDEASAPQERLFSGVGEEDYVTVDAAAGDGELLAVA